MDEQTGELITDGLDGLMTLVQLLVLALQQQGKLDTQAFAQDLLAFRKDERLCPPEAMRSDVLDRMLELLAADRPEVLLRRAQIRLVWPKPQTPDPDGESGL